MPDGEKLLNLLKKQPMNTGQDHLMFGEQLNIELEAISALPDRPRLNVPHHQRDIYHWLPTAMD